MRALDKGGKIQDLNLSLNWFCILANNERNRIRELLCRVFPSCKILHLRNTDSAQFQYCELFSAISTSSSLDELDISKNNLSIVELDWIGLDLPLIADSQFHQERASELGSAVANVVKVKLMETKLTILQTKAIFKRLCEDDKRIEDLDIMFNNLSHLEPDQLATAATKLVRLNLGWTKLNKRQVEWLFERLDENKNHLIELKLSGIDLSALDSRLLTSVAIIFIIINMSNHYQQHHHRHHHHHILNMIFTLDGRLFGRVVSRLEVVDLNFTKLREEQLTELLHKIKGNSQLKDLTLSSNDFLQVIFLHI